MELEYDTQRDAHFLIVEDVARRTDGIEVEYNGKNGTLLKGSKNSFRKVLQNIKDMKSEVWNQMVNTSSNRHATRLDDQSIELRKVRNKLRDALSNADHKWRK